MNITFNTASPASTPALQAAGGVGNVAGTDADGDNDGSSAGGVHSHRGHGGGGGGGGGQLMQAIAQALQGLGLSLTPADNAATGAPASAPAADADGDNDGSQSGGSGRIGGDVRQLMHALFQSLKGAGAVAATSAGSSTDTTATAAGQSAAGGPTGFAGRLAALISEVSSGQAPQGLQDAFNTLVGDLQPATAAQSGAPADAGQSLLLKFLTAFQQDAGYGSTASDASLPNGNLVNQQA